MSRIAIPANIASAPIGSQAMLEDVKRQLGVVPNLFRLVSISPPALEGYLGLSGALAKGALPGPTRERIALAVAQVNGCDYCLSAHAYLATKLAGLDDNEVRANRHGGSNEAIADVAVRFAVKLAHERGRVSDSDFHALRTAGYDDGQIIEIVQHVALNIWTNYMNIVADTDIDFPVVKSNQP